MGFMVIPPKAACMSIFMVTGNLILPIKSEEPFASSSLSYLHKTFWRLGDHLILRRIMET